MQTGYHRCRWLVRKDTTRVVKESAHHKTSNDRNGTSTGCKVKIPCLQERWIWLLVTAARWFDCYGGSKRYKCWAGMGRYLWTGRANIRLPGVIIETWSRNKGCDYPQMGRSRKLHERWLAHRWGGKTRRLCYRWLQRHRKYSGDNLWKKGCLMGRRHNLTDGQTLKRQ